MTDLVVIGQGYVGLPLSRAATRAGLSVVGLERNSETVRNLNAGLSHVGDVSQDDLSEMLTAGYSASNDPGVLADSRYIVICVPTPLADGGRPDLSAVEGAVRDVAKNMTHGSTVILESTTYPGTTEELVLPILETSNLVLDKNFWLAFSPERIDPGNPTYGLENTPKVVGGVTFDSTTKASELYVSFVDTVVQVKSSREAETAKLLENTYRHINIALVNEMARFCHELEIDLWEVINAAKTKPFGFQAFYPGPGVGGHCIPIDPSYLSYQVEKTLGYPFRFVELAEEINNSMPRYIVERIQDLLNEEGKALKGSRVLLLGVTYKADIADQRESPALPIAAILREKGSNLEFHDPRVEVWANGDEKTLRVLDLETALSNADIVVLLQQHRDYDFDAMAETSKIFFDTRGVTSTSSSARRL
ncbi:nucleotide sugar dehydrogenase [Arthrobacter livingstonensis]|uniref:Nucleotide sugar dehydrogenase n=1 Tax=Arthrobacter livingstonensis TaxID=670078 RepID=A0A2V5L857_9MICC|nr:nucleotide sugar dehydrogenase [Arthrobacter livingstonensis]PYI66534.1 nucleotide sugar dehydrogenase [Arthrobacter livingstonensis]